MSDNYPLVYAARHNNSDIRANSRSGGVFTALSDIVLNNGGVVYGCALSENLEAVHIRAVNSEQRNLMCGSKYLQSTQGDIFLQVKKDVMEGKIVLYTGTSCQIAGLKAFLGQEYNNLICMDIVCHSVPSTEVWKKYIKWQEDRHKAKCLKINFRNKNKFGWVNHVETLTMINKKGKTFNVDSRVFANLFTGLYINRPSCYKCPYKSVVHPGDITLGDYWGIEKAAPEFDDNKGVSLLLINNEKGLKLFEKFNGCLEYKKTDIKLSLQPALVKPFEKPSDRQDFWRDLDNCSFKAVAKKYGGLGPLAGLKIMKARLIYRLKSKKF